MRNGGDLTTRNIASSAENTTKMQRLSPAPLAMLLLLGFGPACGQITGGIRPVGVKDNGICEAMQITKYCSYNRSQNTVYLPNARGHNSQTKAVEEFDDFLPLMITRFPCSNGLYDFLCSYYFPLCFNDPLNGNKTTKLKPCRNLCEYVRPPCEAVLRDNNISWPVFLNCSKDDFGDQGSGPCFGPPDPSTAQFTPIDIRGTTRPPPPQKTSESAKNVASVIFTVLGLVAASRIVSM